MLPWLTYTVLRDLADKERKETSITLLTLIMYSKIKILRAPNEHEQGERGRSLSSYYYLHYRVDIHKLIIALCFIQQNNFNVVA